MQQRATGQTQTALLHSSHVVTCSPTELSGTQAAQSAVCEDYPLRVS